MRHRPRVLLTNEQRAQLEKWSRGGSTPYRLVIRSRIVLLAAEGRSDRGIARALHSNPITVARWRSRFVLLGVRGIRTEAPRSGSPPPVSKEVVKRILQKTLDERPPGRHHWSTRSLAREVGVSHSTVRRTWRRYGIRPDRSRVALLAERSRFRPKRIDLVGVYMNPPQRAVALAIEDLANPGPARPSPRPGETAKGPWVLDLASSLNLLNGSATLRTSHRHREQEFLSFLRAVWERQNGREHIVLVTEADGPSLSPRLLRWLSRHPEVSAEVSVDPERWTEKVLESIRGDSEGRPVPPTPVGLPNFLTAVARWKQENTDGALPFAWTEDRSAGSSRGTRPAGRASVYP